MCENNRKCNVIAVANQKGGVCKTTTAGNLGIGLAGKEKKVLLIQKSHIGDEDALRIKSDFLITLCDVIAGGKDGLTNDEKGIIDKCIGKVYEKYFRCPEPENMPVLGDLYEALIKYEPEDVAAYLAAGAREKAVRIANCLVLYVHGSQNYFNHRTNVDSSKRIICFDIKELGSQLKELGMDMAGNVSDSYMVKNPYYKNPEVKEEEDSVSELPKSVLPTQPAEARAAVVDYVNTAKDAVGSKEEKAQTEEGQPEKEQPEEADGALSDAVSESGRSLGKEFYTIRTDNGKVFYLIIDNTQSGDNVYFLTEISENDLLNVTDISYQVMEGNGAAIESALPEREEEKEAEEEKADEGKEEETEPDAGPSADDGAEKRSPALAYGILVLLLGAVAGGIYFFRTYRREGEDFVDDDEEEEDEEEIYEKEEMEKEDSYDEGGMDEGIAGDDDFFYEDGYAEEE